MTDRPALSGHLAALTTILIWGSTFVSTKLLLDAFSPIEILFIRFVLGYLALWAVFPRRLRLADRGQEKWFALAGLCGVTLYYLLENIALTHTLATNVGVLVSVSPFFTALFDCLFLGGKRPGPRFYAGFLLAMAGIALLSFGGGTALHISPLGDLLALGAAIVWALYSTVTRKLASFGYPTVPVTRRTFFHGLVFLLPVLLLSGFHAAPPTPAQAGNLLFLGLGASALCFVTWNFAIRRLGGVRTSIYIYLVPVVTAAFSALILKEPVGAWTLGGIGLTLAGLLLSQNKTKEKEPAYG